MQSTTPVVLTDFRPVSLAEPIDQTEYIENLAHWMIKARTAELGGSFSAAEADELREAVKAFGVKPEYIGARELNAVMPGPEGFSLSTFPDIEVDPFGRDVSWRMDQNDQLLDAAFRLAFDDAEEAPSALVHVTSGGYSAPSPPQRYIAKRGWSDTAVAHIYHMGCFAAFPAVRSAVGSIYTDQALAPNARTRADIFHSEYFSLHVNLNARKPEDIISFTLFGDGFIRYSAVPETALPKGQRALRVIALQDAVVPDSADEMTWRLHTRQFSLHLGKDVPNYINDNCLAFAESLCAKAGFDFHQRKRDLAYAIHTGGPKILDYVQEQFQMAPDKMTHARELLLERGNMSSAACPHLWERILNDDSIAPGTKILSLGFGPGLTVAGMIMEKI